MRWVVGECDEQQAAKRRSGLGVQPSRNSVLLNSAGQQRGPRLPGGRKEPHSDMQSGSTGPAGPCLAANLFSWDWRRAGRSEAAARDRRANQLRAVQGIEAKEGLVSGSHFGQGPTTLASPPAPSPLASIARFPLPPFLKSELPWPLVISAVLCLPTLLSLPPDSPALLAYLLGAAYTNSSPQTRPLKTPRLPSFRGEQNTSISRAKHANISIASLTPPLSASVELPGAAIALHLQWTVPASRTISQEQDLPLFARH